MKLIIDIPDKEWEKWTNGIGIIHTKPLTEALEKAKPLQEEFEEIDNPCIECGGNCCFHEEEGCECQKIYVRKGIKK